jgi:hypothetical protein
VRAGERRDDLLDPGVLQEAHRGEPGRVDRPADLHEDVVSGPSPTLERPCVGVVAERQELERGRLDALAIAQRGGDRGIGQGRSVEDRVSARGSGGGSQLGGRLTINFTSPSSPKVYPNPSLSKTGGGQ